MSGLGADSLETQMTGKIQVVITVQSGRCGSRRGGLGGGGGLPGGGGLGRVSDRRAEEGTGCAGRPEGHGDTKLTWVTSCTSQPCCGTGADWQWLGHSCPRCMCVNLVKSVSQSTLARGVPPSSPLHAAGSVILSFLRTTGVLWGCSELGVGPLHEPVAS